MTSNITHSTDYIILGRGTAGSVVAARLPENPDINIVILESGPDATDDPRVRDPAAWPTLKGSELDWQLKIIKQVRVMLILLLL